ncbi:hypothetical protein [Saccharomonospora sp. CUA-673]|uniref:hypothetical protein n=1 Tax=Saccharomonospora sp. CUA-673 TaxID=1904969 RepID=UPI0021017D10|nr:hypothetical protein [Saccharomonospora sp. CUA-673]
MRLAAAEDLTLSPDEPPYDLAFANRVGALDGRHPTTGIHARARIRAALAPGAPLYVDGVRTTP